MKKKMLMLLLSISLCMQGCGAVEDVPQDEIPVQESVSTEVETPAPEATEEPEAVTPDVQPTATPESTEAPADTASASDYLEVSFDYYYDSYFDGTSLMYGHFNTINLQTADYPLLTKAVEEYNTLRVIELQAYLDSIKDTAISEYKEYGAEGFMGPYSWEGDMSVRRADSKVLSVLEECYDYSGGVHGYSYFDCVNFNVQTGEEIALEDVVTDMDSLPKILEKELTEKYPDTTFFTEPLSDALDDYISSDNPLYQELLKFTWTLDYEGVTFYFGSYEIASYVEGVQQATISYSEYPDILEEKYFSNIPSDYVLKLNDSRLRSDVDLDRDGVTDYIDVMRIYEHDMYMSDAYEVEVNGNAFRQDKYCYELDTYLVKADGKNYLYIQSTADSDWKSVDVYEITTTSVEYMGSFNGNVEGIINSTEFPMVIRLDMLSTYSAEGKSCVGEDGLPVAKGGVYTINREIIITSTVDITAELVDESGNLLGNTYTFPAGTNFTLVTTDGETYVDVLADDGQRGRFYTTQNWPQTINGMDAQSCFEMLYFAG